MSMITPTSKVWLDGELIPAAEASIPLFTHTLHYGVGVFEGVRAYKADKGTAIFRVQEHTKRLFDSARILAMPVNHDYKTLIEAQRMVVRESGFESAYLRPIIFYGHDSLGLSTKNLSTRTAVLTWQWGAYLGEEAIAQGVDVMVSSYTRHLVNSAMARAKVVGDYVNSILARMEAVRCGYQEAIMLDHEGYIAEGTGENIFVVNNGEITTASLGSVLPGITRDTVMKLAADLGYKVQERRVTRDELYIADEVFMTGTAAEVIPVRSVDGRKVGAGQRGEVCEHIQATYHDLIHGRLEQYSEWLTYV